MSSGAKRIAKRSIVGTRVAVPLETGFYVTGVIRAIHSPDPLEEQGSDRGTTQYSVQFDSNRISSSSSGHHRGSGEYGSEDMIGPGFGSLTKDRVLLPNQKVYVTFNGREVGASVVSQDGIEVLLSVHNVLLPHKDSILQGFSGPGVTIKRRVEEVRLLPSRKSARLQEVDTDYARIALGFMDIRKRSSSISSSNSWNSIDLSSTDEGIEVDEAAAAMMAQLQHQGSAPANGHHPPSPFSPSAFSSAGAAVPVMVPTNFKRIKGYNAKPTTASGRRSDQKKRILFLCLWPGCGQKYHGRKDVERHVRLIHLGRPNVEEKKLAEAMRCNRIGEEEEIGIGDLKGGGGDPTKSQNPPTPSDDVGRLQITDDCEGYVDQDDEEEDDDDDDDHEEEFYYTEMEMDDGRSGTSSGISIPSLDSPLSSLCLIPSPSADPATSGTTTTDSDSTNQSPTTVLMAAAAALQEAEAAGSQLFFLGSSAPTLSHMDMARPPTEDPEYRRAVNQDISAAATSSPINIPSGGGGGGNLFGMMMMMDGSGSSRSEPSSCRSPKNTSGTKFARIGRGAAGGVIGGRSMGTTILQHPPGSGGKAGKRSRGESRKCRKVYGMEHKDAWCTQCKWKKACTRFMD